MIFQQLVSLELFTAVSKIKTLIKEAFVKAYTNNEFPDFRLSKFSFSNQQVAVREIDSTKSFEKKNNFFADTVNVQPSLSTIVQTLCTETNPTEKTKENMHKRCCIIDRKKATVNPPDNDDLEPVDRSKIYRIDRNKSTVEVPYDDSHILQTPEGSGDPYSHSALQIYFPDIDKDDDSTDDSAKVSC